MTTRRDDEPQGWFTPRQAAEYLQLSVAMVYRKTQHGELPCYHIGKSRRYRRRDLDRLPKRQRKPRA